MNTRLNKLFALIESDRKHLLSRIGGISPEKLNAAPPGKWSVNLILSHLIIAERMTLAYMEKKVLGINEVEDSGWQEEMKMLILRISQRLPLRFKAPPFVVANTPPHNGIEEIISVWDAEREKLRTFLESFTDLQIRKKIYKHVVAGKMNIQHALLFTREHVLHHTPQIDRLL